MPAAAEPALPSFVEPLALGLWCIDTGYVRDRFDAAYLIAGAGRAAFIDTGTNHAVPRLLEALEALHIPRGDVERVIPTHVHLDHAGGCGALVRELPNARVLVHPRGARHLIDPSALVGSALAVYGEEEMERSYGRVQPIAAARVDTSHDAMEVVVAGRTLHLLDTPGHARHHHAIWDTATRGWFSGDTFGLSYREFDRAPQAGEGDAPVAWMLATSTPVQFEPDALVATIDRLLGFGPQWLYLTHYGRVGDVPRLAEVLKRQVRAMKALGLAHAGHAAGAARHASLKAGLASMYEAEIRAHRGPGRLGEGLDLLAIDIELNAQGLAVWLDRETASARDPRPPREAAPGA
jgi:glyoxylase-like metal-dependent hydrolase (beta-lactamase superfamily II)